MVQAKPCLKGFKIRLSKGLGTNSGSGCWGFRVYLDPKEATFFGFLNKSSLHKSLKR